MPISTAQQGLSPLRDRLDSVENAYVIASRMRHDGVRPVYVVRSRLSLQPIRVSTREPKSGEQAIITLL